MSEPDTFFLRSSEIKSLSLSDKEFVVSAGESCVLGSKIRKGLEMNYEQPPVGEKYTVRVRFRDGSTQIVECNSWNVRANTLGCKQANGTEYVYNMTQVIGFTSTPTAVSGMQ